MFIRISHCYDGIVKDIILDSQYVRFAQKHEVIRFGDETTPVIVLHFTDNTTLTFNYDIKGERDKEFDMLFTLLTS